MNSDYFQSNKRLFRPVLLGVSAVLETLVHAKLRDYCTTSAEAQSTVGEAIDQGKAGAEVWPSRIMPRMKRNKKCSRSWRLCLREIRIAK